MSLCGMVVSIDNVFTLSSRGSSSLEHQFRVAEHHLTPRAKTVHTDSHAIACSLFMLSKIFPILKNDQFIDQAISGFVLWRQLVKIVSLQYAWTTRINIEKNINLIRNIKKLTKSEETVFDSQAIHHSCEKIGFVMW